jgi:hypothetical protein
LQQQLTSPDGIISMTNVTIIGSGNMGQAIAG